ncbi:MAG: hypothetical protein ACJA0X_000628 [Cyclobacteriaceae bacterium]|jgi:hypothetical protein
MGRYGSLGESSTVAFSLIDDENYIQLSLLPFLQCVTMLLILSEK